MGKSQHQIILADDHELVRSGLRLHLERPGDVKVVAEAANGVELIETLTATPCDLVVVDLAMPEMNGLETLAVIAENYPDVRRVVLSGFPDYVREARRLGVSGYLLKSEPSERVADAVRAILNDGRTVFSDGLVVTGEENSGLNSEGQPNLAPGLLTGRELQILKLLARGLKHSEIAAELSVVERTVEFHKRNIKEKLKLSTNAHLVQYAILHQLV